METHDGHRPLPPIKAPSNSAPVADVARLKRLWPNRIHESNWLKGSICALGVHRWYPVLVGGPATSVKCSFCRWCAEVGVLGVSPESVVSD